MKMFAFFTLNAENDDKHYHCLKTNSNFLFFIFHHILFGIHKNIKHLIPYLNFTSIFVLKQQYVDRCKCMLDAGMYDFQLSLFLALTELKKIDLTIVTNGIFDLCSLSPSLCMCVRACVSENRMK